MRLDDCTTSRSCNDNAVNTYLCNIELFIVQDASFARKKKIPKITIQTKIGSPIKYIFQANSVGKLKTLQYL